MNYKESVAYIANMTIMWILAAALGEDVDTLSEGLQICLGLYFILSVCWGPKLLISAAINREQK